MPSPARVVRASHGLLTRRGLASDTAYQLINLIALRCYVDCANAGIEEISWLVDIAEYAAERASSLDPSDTDYKGMANGDGSGGPAGRTETAC